MAYYLVQVAYTAEAWAAMVKNSHVHIEELRSLLERLGGKQEGCWLAFGEYDAVMICHLPDAANAAALSMAASAEGAVRTMKITPLITVEESRDALKKAAGVHVSASSHAASTAGLPMPRPKPVDYKEILSSQLRKLKQRMEKMVAGR